MRAPMRSGAAEAASGILTPIAMLTPRNVLASSYARTTCSPMGGVSGAVEYTRRAVDAAALTQSWPAHAGASQALRAS
ncbi:hypothetical protein GCM10023080_012980 [Streptomyces pseudoechinosporeus]